MQLTNLKRMAENKYRIRESTNKIARVCQLSYYEHVIKMNDNELVKRINESEL